MNKFKPNINKISFKKFRKNKDKFLNISFPTSLWKRFHFGTFGLLALECGYLESLQIEASRRIITRKLERQGKLWIHCFPYKPLTSKGSGVRMGKGKGNISKWVYPVKKGEILFELDKVSRESAKKAFRSASFKLSVNTKFVSFRFIN